MTSDVDMITRIAAFGGLVVSIVGWFVTYRLTLKSQSNLLVHQLRNEARREIIRDLRDYQEWLTDYTTLILKAKIDALQYAEISDLVSRSPVTWVYSLEDYEILFPATRQCRQELLTRHNSISNFVLAHAVLSQDQSYSEAVSAAAAQRDFVLDQVALIEDLKVYIQNLCLAGITGYTVPERTLRDPSLPKLVEDKSGNLVTVPGHKND